MLKTNEHKKRTHEERKKLAVRIIAMILAALMVGSMAYYTIYILASTIRASDIDTETSSVIDTSSLWDSEDVLVSVGLMYGDNITTGFQCETDYGYTIGEQYLDDDKNFEEIWDIDTEVISCTSDANLSKTDMTFLITDDEDDCVIGGYHIEVDCSDYDRDELEKLIDDTERDVERLGLYTIPSYINSEYMLRIGSFESYRDADEYVSDVEDIFDGEDVYVVSPSVTAVSVLDPYDDIILFEYDCEGESELGLTAHEDDNGNTYIMTPAKNVYDGVFCFKRYDNGETDGVSLINILPLESYVAGVLPYETSNSWLFETLKAFAITVRSFTLTHLYKHKQYGFDLCATTECQVYKGAGRINDNVLNAVSDTKGEVMTYDGDIVNAYYSSSMGGVTVSAKDAWGSSTEYPYLTAVETPWENYMVHNNGFWINEVSPEDLLERLHQAGYDELEDAIEDVEIIELAKNSTYVKTLRVTDIYGTSVDITTTDKVRTSLTPYVKSANFVVGKGEVEYTENVVVDYVSPEYDSSSDYDLDYGYTNVADCYVMTSDYIGTNDSGASVVLTGNDKIIYNRKDVFVITKQNASAFLGDEYKKYAEEDTTEEDTHITEEIAEKSTDEIKYKVAYADDSDNFIFVGKGWGHGVGMSQYGALDMAALGYSSNEILEAYFKDIDIVNYWRTNNFD